MRKKIGLPFISRKRQQGDVHLELVALPPGLKRRSGPAILALGEVTGHKHEVIGEDLEVYEAKDGTLYTVAPHGGTVQHEEHHPQTLEPTPPGHGWKSWITREYDHFAEEARPVAD